jgi:hypothetical protein
MTQNPPDTEAARIDAEIEALKGQLRAFEETIHGELKSEPEPNWNRIRGIENRIREIVLRLVDLERALIELHITGG